MKIKITRTDKWLKDNRHIEIGHIFNVLRDRKGNVLTGIKDMHVKHENRKRLVKWYFIATHGNKNIVVYDWECEEIETVEMGIVTELRRYFKTIIE